MGRAWFSTETSAFTHAESGHRKPTVPVGHDFPSDLPAFLLAPQLPFTPAIVEEQISVDLWLIRQQAG